MGHLFYFLADVVPQVYGKDLLVTPLFLIDYFGVGHYVPNQAQREARNNPYSNEPAGNEAGGGGPTRGGHSWGGGRALGRE